MPILKLCLVYFVLLLSLLTKEGNLMLLPDWFRAVFAGYCCLLAYLLFADLDCDLVCKNVFLLKAALLLFMV